jgi:hypothetical protein
VLAEKPKLASSNVGYKLLKVRCVSSTIVTSTYSRCCRHPQHSMPVQSGARMQRTASVVLFVTPWLPANCHIV